MSPSSVQRQRQGRLGDELLSGRSETWTVDRVEAGIAVLVRDDDDERKVNLSQVNLPLTSLPSGSHEGTVLSVPVEGDGEPDWAAAAVDEALRQARTDEAEAILKRLRKRDPGGDIVL